MTRPGDHADPPQSLGQPAGTPGAAAGWREVLDENGRRALRYWDGSAWLVQPPPASAGPLERLHASHRNHHYGYLIVTAVVVLTFGLALYVLVQQVLDARDKSAWIASYREGWNDACEQILPSNREMYMGPGDARTFRSDWCETSQPKLFPSDLTTGDQRYRFAAGRSPEMGYRRGYQGAVRKILDTTVDGRVCFTRTPDSCVNREQLLTMFGIPLT